MEQLCNTKKTFGIIVFNSDIAYVSKGLFITSDQQIWKELYAYTENTIPTNILEPKGEPVKVSKYICDDHTINMLTRRSHTGIIIYITNAPIIWFSKGQNTVETPGFGSEFIKVNIASKTTLSLFYKLRMFGVKSLVLKKLSVITSHLS